MKLTEVIRRPLITEKSNILREDGQTLVFQVAVEATKIEIKHAVEKMFETKVATVRTAIVHGKTKAAGALRGATSGLEESLRAAPRRHQDA